jgi:hypothetical protein
MVNIWQKKQLDLDILELLFNHLLFYTIKFSVSISKKLYAEFIATAKANDHPSPITQ